LWRGCVLSRSSDPRRNRHSQRPRTTVFHVVSVEAYLREVRERTRSILADDLVGIYLHGSAATGTFVATRSDIDVLVVTRSELSREAKTALAASLAETALPCPGVGLELSVVTAASARAPSDAPAFELHIATQEARVVDGRYHAGDADLVAAFAMTRARGVSLFGPPPSEVFASVDTNRLLRTFADDLEWAVDHDLPSYAVLNACRALRFMRDFGLYSKLEGGAWAIEEGVGDPRLIRAALRRQRGNDELVDPAAAASFAAGVRAELFKAASQDNVGS
jgi:predicted nucleotidyltransferase